MKIIKVSGQNELKKNYMCCYLRVEIKHTTYVCLINLSFFSSLMYLQNPLVKIWSFFQANSHSSLMVIDFPISSHILFSSEFNDLVSDVSSTFLFWFFCQVNHLLFFNILPSLKYTHLHLLIFFTMKIFAH